MKKLTVDMVEWKIECLTENTCIRGNLCASGNDADDKEEEDLIIEELTWNEWAWCLVKVTGTWNGLSASDHLGGCSYDSEKDFIQSSGYYADMQAVILDELQTQAEKIAREVTA